MITIRATGVDEAQTAFANAAGEVSPDGLVNSLTMALAQLSRFVAGNIEVDKGRTKNSVFQHVSKDANGVTAMLGTNVRYAPFVRDGSHSMQFFEYARQREVPNVLKQLDTDIVARVEGHFD